MWFILGLGPALPASDLSWLQTEGIRGTINYCTWSITYWKIHHRSRFQNGNETARSKEKSVCSYQHISSIFEYSWASGKRHMCFQKLLQFTYPVITVNKPFWRSHIAVRGVAIDYPLGLPLDFFFLSLFLGHLKIPHWHESLVASLASCFFFFSFNLGLFVCLGLLSSSVICLGQIVHFSVTE